MRSLFDKLMDYWGTLSAFNQYGIAFLGAVVVIVLLWSIV